MAVTRITEKTIATELKDGANILVTQQELVNGSVTESLRRVPINLLHERVSDKLGLSIVDGELCITYDVDAVTESDFTLTLANNVVTVGEGAYEGSNYEIVIINDGCTSIGSRAFANCSRLQTVVIPESVVSIADDAFANHPANMMIRTPYNSYAASYAELHDIKTFS